MEYQDIRAQMEPSTILLVVDDEIKAARLTPVLAAESYCLETVLSFSVPLPQLAAEPDLGIIWFPYTSPDALPELANIVKAIQSLGKTTQLPVLLIIDQDGARWVEPSFRLGITDILTRPLHPLILRQRIRLLLQARQNEELLERLKRRMENQQRQRMINALDSALQMFRTDLLDPPSGEPVVSKVPSPFSIHSDMLFDPERHCLISNLKTSSGVKKIELTADQCAILLYMISHPYRAISNYEIARSALGYEHMDEIQSRSIVRPHILRLRRKLEEDSSQPKILHTVRGSGYVFSPD